MLTQPGLGYSYSVLVDLLVVLQYWISGTCNVLVLVRTKVIVLVLVLVLVDKYSGTRTRTGTSTDILWYISCKGENYHTCEINSLTYHEGKVPNWFILLLWLNIWYMGCACKFHNVFQFYYHRKINWITIMMLSLLLSFVQVHFPI